MGTPPAPWRQWRQEGILQLDMEPGMYLYEEEFLSQADRGETRKVRGLVCRVRLSDFAEGVVLPHEETLSKAKEDRFQLLCATRCNFSSIYCLYQDPGHTTAQRLENLSQTCPPRYEFSDGLVTHRLWVVNDPVAISGPAGGFCRPEAVHCRRPPPVRNGPALPGLPAAAGGLPAGDAEYILMTLTDMEDPGLTVFPTHRLVRGLPSFDSAKLLAACEKDFTLAGKASREESQAALEEAYQQGKHAFALYDGAAWTLLHPEGPGGDGRPAARHEPSLPGAGCFHPAQPGAGAAAWALTRRTWPTRRT